MEILILALVLGGLMFAALGVEDTRHWKAVEGTPAVRVPAPSRPALWEDSLPSAVSLPSWGNKSAA